VTEVTQSVVPCRLPAHAHLRALRDLSTLPNVADLALSRARIYFNFAPEVVYSGFARVRDDFDSPVRDAPDFTIQVWHGDKVFRTMQICLANYAGILHVQLPEGGDPKDYFVKDLVRTACGQRPELAPAVIGYDYLGRTMIRLPEVEGEEEAPDKPFAFR